MEITVKARFNASTERVEKYGNNMYLAYLPFQEDEDSIQVLISILSRYMGVPAGRINFAGKNARQDWIFQFD